MAQQPYYAPSYFSTFYFPDLAAIEVVDPSYPPSVTPLLPVSPEILAIEAIVRRLRDLGIFGDVLLVDDQSVDPPGVAGYPAAVVSLKGWTDEDENSTDQVRTAEFAIRIVDEQDRAFSRVESLVSLARAARQQLQNSDLDGLAIPGLTRLKTARLAKGSVLPGSTLQLDGEFAYFLEPTAVVAVRS